LPSVLQPSPPNTNANARLPMHSFSREVSKPGAHN
jgi:hypothetical protein